MALTKLSRRYLKLLYLVEGLLLVFAFSLLLLLDAHPELSMQLVNTNQEDSPFVALAGASENRFDALMNLLASLNHHEPLMKTIVIDFGLAHASIRELEHWCRYCKNRGYGGCEIRRFVSSKYSSHMPANADVGAWKAILIKEALNQFPLVIWLDVDFQITDRLDSVKRTVQDKGFIASRPSHIIKKPQPHPGMLSYFKTNFNLTEDLQAQLENQESCEGGLTGWNRNSPAYHNVLVPWAQCVIARDCIPPPESEQDSRISDQQAALSLLVLMNQFHCEAELPIKIQAADQKKRDRRKISEMEFLLSNL